MHPRGAGQLLSNWGSEATLGKGGDLPAVGRGWGGTHSNPHTGADLPPGRGAQGILTTPWREGGIRPQYTGMKVLQTLAWRVGTERGQ